MNKFEWRAPGMKFNPIESPLHTETKPLADKRIVNVMCLWLFVVVLLSLRKLSKRNEKLMHDFQN